MIRCKHSKRKRKINKNLLFERKKLQKCPYKLLNENVKIKVGNAPDN